MIVLSNREMQAFRALSLKQRRKKLKRLFLNEIGKADEIEEHLIEFFDRGFDAAMKLLSMNDKEILRLCWIAYYKRTEVISTAEYERCQQEQKWSGRSLYLCATLERLAKTVLQTEVTHCSSI